VRLTRLISHPLHWMATIVTVLLASLPTPPITPGGHRRHAGSFTSQERVGNGAVPDGPQRFQRLWPEVPRCPPYDFAGQQRNNAVATRRISCAPSS
jgi:hypothetical protein